MEYGTSVTVDKVVETRVATTLRELLCGIIDEHFDGTDDLYIFVDNRKVSVDAPVSLTQFEKREERDEDKVE